MVMRRLEAGGLIYSFVDGRLAASAGGMHTTGRRHDHEPRPGQPSKCLTQSSRFTYTSPKAS